MNKTTCDECKSEVTIEDKTLVSPGMFIESLSCGHVNIKKVD